MTRFAAIRFWKRPTARRQSATSRAARWCLALVLFAPFAARSLAADHGDDARFSTIHGRAGFWRIGKTRQGVWWFVSPKGQIDFLNTVTTVQPTVRGRDPLGPDFLSRDFDERDASPLALDRWAHAAAQRVQNAGFKGIGAWSNPALHQCDIPMTQDLNLSAWTRNGPSLMYAPGWSAMIEYAIKTQVEPLRENANLVGYYLDNEMDWSDESVGPRVYFDNLPQSDPNRREVVGAIRNTWPSVQAFNKDWNTQLLDWRAMDDWQALPAGTTAAQDKLTESWQSHLAETYFQITTSLLRKYDPNHLVLGIRYRGSAPLEVVRASKGYTDAQSLNYYVNDARLDGELFKMMATESDQPIVISEYSFHALDGRSGDRNTVGFDAQVPDQKARGEAYKAFTTRLARVPYVIGADWFQWMDEPPSGRQVDGEDVNFGVVDIDDQPYAPLVEAIRSTAPLLNDLHDKSDADKQQDVWREDYAQRPVFHVPLLEKPIKINGELSDWPAACKLPGVHAPSAVGADRAGGQEPNIYVGWSRDGISLAFEVFDKDVTVAPPTAAWWARDCVEFWISTRAAPREEARFNPYCHHFFFLPVDQPGVDGASGLVGQWHAPGDYVGHTQIPNPDIKTVTRILPDRYVTEMFIPARALYGFDPYHQPQLAFNIDVRNYRHAEEFFWSAPKAVLTQCRPVTWGSLYLSLPSEAPRDNSPQQPVANIASEASK